MKIGGLQPLSLSDYPATPATVVFLQGCNLRCPYCHNRSLLPDTSDNLIPPEQVVTFLEKRQCKVLGVVVSGGEPTLQSELAAFLLSIQNLGYKIKLDTNGTRPEEVRSCLNAGLVNYIAMDIKAPWPKYSQLAGTDVPIDVILESISIISRSGIPHHFRTTYYPTLLEENDLTEIKASLPAQSQYVIQKYILPSQR